MNTDQMRMMARESSAEPSQRPELTVERMRTIVKQQPILVFAGLAILFCAFVLV